MRDPDDYKELSLSHLNGHKCETKWFGYVTMLTTRALERSNIHTPAEGDSAKPILPPRLHRHPLPNLFFHPALNVLQHPADGSSYPLLCGLCPPIVIVIDAIQLA